MKNAENASVTTVVTDVRWFDDARSMADPSSTRAFAVVTTPAAYGFGAVAGFGDTTGVALLPTRNVQTLIDPSRFGTRSWSPPV